MDIVYERIRPPVIHEDYIPVDLTKETMDEHKQRVLKAMEEKGLDILLVYGDREHGGAFSYLTGFEPRFEEGVLVLHKNGECFLLLGNENLKMAKYSFAQGKVIHVPHFSLPCQPMETDSTLEQLFAEAGLKDGMEVGCAGWKYFTGPLEDNQQMYEIPSFIIEAVRKNNAHGKILHASDIFLHPERGLRIQCNGNEIAHYEFGAGLASGGVYRAMEAVSPGKTEMEIASNFNSFGQPLTVTAICATGERFTNGVVFPRNKKIERGQKVSFTFGLRGGLSSRAAYAAEGEQDLPEEEKEYLVKVAIPYYRAAVTWYENVGIGVPGSEIYEKIEEVLPKEKFGWTLNPGHYTGNDEWISSPFSKESSVVLRSGMILQMDIIPSVPGYGGANAEDGIALADEALRKEIEAKYPDVWRRMMDRRNYMQEVLGISLREEVLPMSDICGYFRPFLLDHARALKKKE